MDKPQSYILKLHSLVIFRNLLNEIPISQFLTLLNCLENSSAVEQVSAYSSFLSELFHHKLNWSQYLLSLALEDENLYIQKVCQSNKIPDVLEEALKQELSILEEISKMKSSELCSLISYHGFLPQFLTEEIDFIASYQERMMQISSHGYGIFAKYHMFILKDGRPVPVQHPDTTNIEQLSGYEIERKEVLDNTLALLQGKPAANILLYGDAGTGKSSTVKAAANYYQKLGVRLIEVKKEQLYQIPELIDYLSQNPLKFILFIDDLSFTRDDDNFSALKAVLEGSVSAKTQNIVIYATSNRRHLVKESFSDRDGDDIHFNDTMQELTSLSDRFGLTITFSRPDKKQYLSIASALAKQYKLQLSEEEFISKADRYAIRRCGYSPRVAKQFVESLRANIPEEIS